MAPSLGLENINVDNSKKNKVAILAVNYSATFHNLNLQLILIYLVRLFAGPKMLHCCCCL